MKGQPAFQPPMGTGLPGGPGSPGMSGPGPWGEVAAAPPALWKRAERAVTVLERIGTPEAREIVRQVARGEPEALPTQAAQAALERMKKPSGRRRL